MKRLATLLALALALGPWSGAAAGGAWTSYIRVSSYAGLATARDTVWCATREAGLLRFDAAGGRYDSFTREPGGLASNQLTSVALDRSGRIWAGTLDKGVSLLSADRTAWELLSVKDGLPSDEITVIEAVGDTVYIGTAEGIALWDGNQIAGAIPPDQVNPSPFANNRITGIAQLGDSVWVSTPAGIYVSRLSDVPLTWSTANDNLVSTDIRGLATDGISMFAFGNTVPYIFHFGTKRWGFAGDIGPIGQVARLDHGNGAVTISTRNGIYRWNPTLDGLLPGTKGEWELVQGGPAYASSLAPDSLLAVYAVAADPALGFTYAANLDGVHTLTPTCAPCPVVSPPGPPGNNIINLALQPTSTGAQLYVSTFTEGIGRFDGTGWRNWPARPNPCANCDTTFIYPIYTFGLAVAPSGKKWVACWSGALEEFDDAVSPPSFTPSFTHHYEAWAQEFLAPERHSFGWATTFDPDGGFWIGLETNGQGNPPPPALGLDYYLADGTYVRNFSPTGVVPVPAMRGGQIRGLTTDGRGRTWVGYTGQGLQYFDWPLVSGVPDFRTVAGTETYYIQSLRAFGDSLWVLTTSDLRRYAGRTARPALNSVFSPPAQTAQNALRPLEVGPDGTVWLGTENGMRIYRPGGGIEDFKTTNSPLASDAIRAIVVDPKTGVAWIGTSAGLNRYDPGYVPGSTGVAEGLRIRAYPNPLTLTGIGTAVRLDGGGDVYEGEIYDLGGRVVNRFSAVRDGQVCWNGIDLKGAVVKPGVYFVRATSRGRSATARVALVR